MDLTALGTEGHKYCASPLEILTVAAAVDANLVITRGDHATSCCKIIGVHLCCLGGVLPFSFFVEASVDISNACVKIVFSRTQKPPQKRCCQEEEARQIMHVEEQQLRKTPAGAGGGATCVRKQRRMEEQRRQEPYWGRREERQT